MLFRVFQALLLMRDLLMKINHAAKILNIFLFKHERGIMPTTLLTHPTDATFCSNAT